MTALTWQVDGSRAAPTHRDSIADSIRCILAPMFWFFLKSRALKRLRHELYPVLARGFGGGEYYSAQQIRQVIQNREFDPRCSEYAMAMFLTPEDFHGLAKGVNLSRDYSSLREWMALRYYKDDVYYSSPGNFFAKEHEDPSLWPDNYRMRDYGTFQGGGGYV